MALPTEEGIYTRLFMLNPPTTVAGRSGEVAKVTAVYQRGDDGVLRRVGQLQIEVLWGATAQQIRGRLIQDRLRAQQIADTKIEEIDDDLTTLPP